MKHPKISAIMPLLSVACFSVFGATVTIGNNKEVLVDGKPFFPLMQWLQNSPNMATQKQYGINTFLGQGDGSSALAYCNEAQKQGVYAVPLWKASEVNSVKTHPAFLGWVFADEPDLQDNRIQPSQIKSQYQTCKSQDPSHITFLTITGNFYSKMTPPDWMNGSDAYYYDYPLYTDVIGFDLYPVYGYCQPSWVYYTAESQRELVNKYAKGKTSTFQWIECSKTSSEWCSMSSRGAEDGPYDYEILNEVWLAIAEGANAIGYFTHSWKCPGYAQCCISAKQIAMLKSVNARITALTEVLCAPESPVAVDVQMVDPKGMIVTRMKEYAGSLYLIAVSAVNRVGAQATQQAAFSIAGLCDTVRVHDEGRTITAKGGVFSDNFTNSNPVHIYVFPSTNAVRSQKTSRASTLFKRARLTTPGSPVLLSLASGSSKVTVKIYSSCGAHVRTIENNNGQTAVWDCRDDRGVRVGPGLYYVLVPQGNADGVIPIMVR